MSKKIFISMNLLFISGVISRYYCKIKLVTIVFLILRNAEKLLVKSKENTKQSYFLASIEPDLEKNLFEAPRDNVDSTNVDSSDQNDLIPSMPKDASRLKAACLCIISGFMIHCASEVLAFVDAREILLIGNILQLTSMASLHSRCITFMNNIYLSKRFESLILSKIIPPLSTLMMHNITNFLKADRKKTITDDPNREIDRVYRDNLYKEFISCSCEFLSNVSSKTPVLEGEHNFVEVMSLLLINSEELNQDTILFIVKCLCNFSNSPEYRMKLSNQKVAEACMKVLEYCWKEDVKSFVFLFIANMCGTGSLCKHLINLGIIGKILEFLTVCKGSYRRYAILALANISYEDYSIHQIVGFGGIDVICTLCYSSVAHVRRQATRVLYSICQYSRGIYHKKLIGCKAEKALKYVLRKSTDPDEHTLEKSVVDMALFVLVRLRASSRGKIKEVEAFEDELDIEDKTFDYNLLEVELPKEENKRLAEEEKKIGNLFYTKKKWDKAVAKYTEGLKYDPTNVVLYCNRSAAYIQLEEFRLALSDANQCIEIDPTWVKGYFRKGKALIHLYEFTDAIEILERALTIDDNKEIRGALNYAYEQKLKDDHYVDLQYKKFGLDDIVLTFEKCSIIYSAKLLHRMRQIWEECVSENISEPTSGASMDDIAHRIYIWAKMLDINQFIQLEGIQHILFHTNIIHETDYDVVCNTKSQYDILIVILLSRYVFESFEWRVPAMKRLLELGMNPHVRKHIGTFISEIFLQKSKEESLRIPSHSKLFVRLGGLKNLALDFEEFPSLKSDIVDFFDSVTVSEWRSRPIEEIDFILEHLFSVVEDSKDKIDAKLYNVFGKLFSLPAVKDLDEEKSFDENDFLSFIQKEIQRNLIESVDEELLGSENEYKKIGYEIGKKWIRAKGVPSLEDDIL